MARRGLSLKRRRELEFLQYIILMINVVVLVYMMWYSMKEASNNSQRLEGKKRMRRRLRLSNLNRFIGESDDLCRKHLRMDRFTFNKLCEMVKGIGGLSRTRHMSVEEIVAIFLYILAHHKTNRYVGAYFYRSGETVSRQFHLCLKAVLKLHTELLKKPSPITEDCSDDKWKFFKNCVGAVDCTLVSVSVPPEDRSKYRTRKGSIAMNVLGACSPDMEFVYVLPGWEGSVDDGRVLCDAISRPNGLVVPQGCYYLCNAGYGGEGFLAPFRGHPYNLSEWNNGSRQPQSAEENFNLRHAMARNVMKQCFGLLKGRWKILRSPSWFSLKTHGRIVLACCLLHNLIKRYMPPGSIYEDISDDENDDGDGGGDDDEDSEVEYISSIDTLIPCTNFRNSLAQTMFNSCLAGGHGEMDDSSSAIGSRRGRNKRFWNSEEDKALIDALHELSTDPRWKCDYGFRNGYMIRLEEMIGKSVPGCGLKASPHIDSRLKTLVGKFRAILQMLATKGFKWDEKKHMICVERSVYEEYCKAHPTCKNLYGVSFPHLHVMMEIYGKDFATGKPAEGFLDAVDNMDKEEVAQVNIESSDDDVGGSGILTTESAPPLKKVKRDKTSKKKGSDKAAQSSSDLELACLQNFMKDMNAHLSTMANVWSRADDREQDIADKCNKVLGELLQLDGLTPAEALEAANTLTAQPNKLNIFFNCPTYLKRQYVKSLFGSSDNGCS